MSNALEVASLFATLSLDDRLTPALGGIGDTVRSWGASLQRTGANITGIGSSLQTFTAPIQNFLTSGVNVAAEFESSLAEIQARAGLTSDELARVSDFALQMGADTAFSGQQALDAFLQLLTSGQTIDEAIGMLPAVLDAAAASGTDLGLTADSVTNILAAMNLEVGDTAGVVDALSRAAGASSASMDDMMASFDKSAGVAAMYGVNYNQLAAIFGVLADNSLKGEEAGTALRSMLSNMTSPVQDVQLAWGELGVSLYDAEGNMRDLNAVMTEVDAALDALPMEDQIRLSNRLAGTYGIVAFNALRGENTIKGMEEAMLGAAGASDVARARMDTFNGRVDTLFGSLDTLKIRGLEPMLDAYLTPLVDDLIGVVNGVTDWVQANPELTSQIVMIAAGAVALVGALVPLGMVFGALGTVVSVLGSAIGVLLSPVALAIAGFVGLLAAGGELETWFNNIKGIVSGDLADGLSKIGTALGDLFSGDPAKQAQALTDIGDGLGLIGTSIKDMAVVTFDSIVTSLENLTGLDLRGPLDDIGNFITTVAGLADQFVIQPIVEGLEGLAAGAEQFVNTLVSDIDPAALQGIIDFLGQLGTALAALVGGVIAVGGELIGETLGAIGDALPGLAGGIADLINTVGGLLNGTIDPAQALNDIGTAIGHIGASLLQIPVDAADGLIEALNALDGEGGLDLPTLTEAFSAIKTAIDEAGTALSNWWTGTVQPALQPVIEFFSEGGAGHTALVGVWDAVQSAIETVSGVLTALWDTIRPHLEAVAAGFASILNPIIENVITPIKNAINDVIFTVEDLARRLGLLGIDGVSPVGSATSWAVAPDVEALLAAIPGQASGGPVGAGRPYIVGEQGAELFVPSSNGTIIPNDALGGGRQPVVINLTTIGTNEREFADLVLRALRDRGI